MAALIGNIGKVSFMRAEHAPTSGNFAAHSVDISDALAGVRKAAQEIERVKIAAAKSALPMLSMISAYADYRMPSRPNDRRTVRVLGKAKHWYADRDGKLHLADGESPWT